MDTTPRHDTEDAESHWFHYAGWRVLKGTVCRLAEAELARLIEDLSQKDRDLEAAVDGFLTRMATSANRRRLTSGASKWAYVITLLGEPQLLKQMISADPILSGKQKHLGTPPEAAFWQLFGYFLNRARQRQRGTSVQRIGNWERLDKVSRKIAAEHDTQGRFVDRMSTEHILEVQARCLKNWPTDKNVNLDLPTLRGYFEEFCDDARQPYDSDATSASTERYQNLIHDTQDRPAVRVCLDRLARHDQDLWDALLVKLELHPTVTLPISAFAAKIGVSRHEMGLRYDEASRLIKECIINSLNMLLRK